VHIRRDGARPAEAHPPSALRTRRAETWSEGFRAKPAQPLPQQEIPEAVPEPVQPVVHVMPMWQPSAPQPEPPSVETERRLPRSPRGKTPKSTAQRFADPFAEGEDGANFLRCGYLVEPARERRGLLTCASCG